MGQKLEFFCLPEVFWDPKMRFRPGPSPGETHDALPNPIVGWGGDIPPQTLPHSAPSRHVCPLPKPGVPHFFRAGYGRGLAPSPCMAAPMGLSLQWVNKVSARYIEQPKVSYWVTVQCIVFLGTQSIHLTVPALLNRQYSENTISVCTLFISRSLSACTYVRMQCCCTQLELSCNRL